MELPAPSSYSKQASIFHKTRPLFIEHQGHFSPGAKLYKSSTFTNHFMTETQEPFHFSELVLRNFQFTFSYINTGYWSFYFQNEKGKDLRKGKKWQITRGVLSGRWRRICWVTLRSGEFSSFTCTLEMDCYKPKEERTPLRLRGGNSDFPVEHTGKGKCIGIWCKDPELSSFAVLTFKPYTFAGSERPLSWSQAGSR